MAFVSDRVVLQNSAERNCSVTCGPAEPQWPDAPRNEGGHCPVCSDEALPARVLSLLPGGIAEVELHGAIEEVDVQLVDAAVGDVILVHANVAIAKISGVP